MLPAVLCSVGGTSLLRCSRLFNINLKMAVLRELLSLNQVISIHDPLSYCYGSIEN